MLLLLDLLRRLRCNDRCYGWFWLCLFDFGRGHVVAIVAMSRSQSTYVKCYSTRHDLTDRQRGPRQGPRPPWWLGVGRMYLEENLKISGAYG